MTKGSVDRRRCAFIDDGRVQVKQEGYKGKSNIKGCSRNFVGRRQSSVCGLRDFIYRGGLTFTIVLGDLSCGKVYNLYATHIRYGLKCVVISLLRNFSGNVTCLQAKLLRARFRPTYYPALCLNSSFLLILSTPYKVAARV